MKTLEIRRLFGGNCVIGGACDPPVTIASVHQLRAQLREYRVPEDRISQALLELKDSRHLTITLPS